MTLDMRSMNVFSSPINIMLQILVSRGLGATLKPPECFLTDAEGELCHV